MRTTTKAGLLSAAIREAEAESTAIQRQCEEAQAQSTNLLAKRLSLEAALQEAKITESMGGAPPRSLAELAGEFEVVRQSVESAEARSIGLQRALDAAQAKIESAKQALQKAQLAHAEKLAPQFCHRMWQDIQNAHSAQLDLIALVRTLQNLGFHPREIAHLFPRYLLFFEIGSSFEAESLKREKKAWPAFGDRRVGNELIGPQMENLRAELEAL